MKEPKTLTPCELIQACGRQGAVVLDLRTSIEYEEKRLEIPHIHIPLHELTVQRLQAEGVNFDTPVYLLCQSGQRSIKAFSLLNEWGFRDLSLVKGGLIACTSEGLVCVSTDKGFISLERQMRITAGVLVVVGILLAEILNPYFIILSLVMGLGLAISGITNWCGMALLLAKAPWNRIQRRGL